MLGIYSMGTASLLLSAASARKMVATYSNLLGICLLIAVAAGEEECPQITCEEGTCVDTKEECIPIYRAKCMHDNLKRCHDDKGCFTIKEECDGTINCLDGSDESDCSGNLQLLGLLVIPAIIIGIICGVYYYKKKKREEAEEAAMHAANRSKPSTNQSVKPKPRPKPAGAPNPTAPPPPGAPKPSAPPAGAPRPSQPGMGRKPSGAPPPPNYNDPVRQV